MRHLRNLKHQTIAGHEREGVITFVLCIISPVTHSTLELDHEDNTSFIVMRWIVTSFRGNDTIIYFVAGTY